MNIEQFGLAMLDVEVVNGFEVVPIIEDEDETDEDIVYVKAILSNKDRVKVAVCEGKEAAMSVMKLFASDLKRFRS